MLHSSQQPCDQTTHCVRGGHANKARTRTSTKPRSLEVLSMPLINVSVPVLRGKTWAHASKGSDTRACPPDGFLHALYLFHTRPSDLHILCSPLGFRTYPLLVLLAFFPYKNKEVSRGHCNPVRSSYMSSRNSYMSPTPSCMLSRVFHQASGDIIHARPQFHTLSLEGLRKRSPEIPHTPSRVFKYILSDVLSPGNSVHVLQGYVTNP